MTAVQTRPTPWTSLGLAAIAALTLLGARAQAQQPIIWSRARDACNAAAVRAGYVIMRRDHETVTGHTYAFPWHVRHGNDESDVVCRYDGTRGLVDLPGFARERVAAGQLETQHQRAQRRCESFVNATSGYQVQNVGAATRRGGVWDVSMTVRRNRRDGVAITCRYNPSSNKLTIRY